MKSIKNSIIAKTIAFLVVQVCVVTIVLSGIIVIFNAGYGWYSSTSESVKEDVLGELATEVSFEIHDGLYYLLECEDTYEVTWPEYLLKNNDLPEGIGYKLEILDNKERPLGDIKLKKNVSLGQTEGVYADRLYNDLYKLTVYVADPLEVGEPAFELYPEDLAVKYNTYMHMYQNRINSAAILMGALFVVILLMVYLVSTMKSSAESKNIIKKIPVDLAFCVVLCIGAIACFVLGNGPYDVNYDAVVLVIVAISLVISVTLTLFVLFFIYRVKCGEWWKNTAVNVVLNVMKSVVTWLFGKVKCVTGVLAAGVRKLPLVWKTIAAVVVILLANLFVSINFIWSPAAPVFWMLGAVLVGTAVIYISLCLKRLQKGGRKLAEGDLDYKIDTKGLFMDFAEHAENLNMIGDGMAVAVEDRIKSEKFKAELITNVSHDIKTPLTSIINYVDLLSKEEFENEKVNEYVEVLNRQSKRLKKLTEDILDASKASTGNIKMELSPCKIGLLLSQTMGEYMERAETNNLEFVLKVPDEELEILADGRRLWRVFDNLLNNICKYSQPGTRAYLTLEQNDGKAVITYRNISKYELDITEEELMERFVRGDRSRNTEGSGLGLSIARNLVELQGGHFDISIDGDLFKVVIMFPVLNL